jgi:hypothetical protein
MASLKYVSRRKIVRAYQNGVYQVRSRVSKVQYVILTATLVGFVSGFMAVL